MVRTLWRRKETQKLLQDNYYRLTRINYRIAISSLLRTTLPTEPYIIDGNFEIDCV